MDKKAADGPDIAGGPVSPMDPAASSEDAFAALIRRVQAHGQRAAPVERWNPPYCGDIEMCIHADGHWSYMGTPIGRQALVNLFASVLRRDDDGKYYLVTPVEKIGIQVDDAAFLAVDMAVHGTGRDQLLTLSTNVGDQVCVGPDHPLRSEVEPHSEGLKPYVRVRGRLEALASRALCYDLVAKASVERIDNTEQFGLWSAGMFFPLGRAADVYG